MAGIALALSPSTVWAQGKPKPKPNILFVLTDDQLCRNFGCYGSKEGLTPNMDRLAAGGVRFTRACVTTPLCSPSRVTCLTGRYAGRFGAGPRNTWGMPVAQPTIAGLLKNAGYQTGFVGKAHMGFKGAGGKRLRGKLDDKLKSIGFTHVENPHMARFGKGDHLKHQEEDFDAAVKFIKANKNRPFALFLFTTLTHGPHEAPKEYLAKVKRNHPRPAMTLWLDALTGRLMKTLDTLGLRQNTAIFYAGDNAGGGPAKKIGANKSTLYDGWVPQVVSWPGGIKSGQVVDETVQNIDYLPTILDICGVPVPKSAKTDGMSFLPLMTGKKVKWREETFFEVSHGCAVRTDQWKYMAFREIKGALPKLEIQLRRYGGQRDLLFNVKADPLEEKNLFKDPACAKVVADMQARLKRFCATNTYPFGEFGGKT